MEATEMPETEEEQAMVRFTTVDYTVFILMLVVSVAIGVISAVRSRDKATTQEYLLGGRAMSPVPVALSLLGGWISAISILGKPTEIYFFGTQLAMALLGCVPGCIFVGLVILPTFYQLKLVSINEYIQIRFGSRLLRTLTTLCLLLTNVIYMGVVLYAPTMALSTVTGISIWASTLTMGIICTFYITIGGVRAVVYTDVLQTLIMFGGVLAVVIICCVDLGGVDNVWDIALQGGRIKFFDLNTSLYERHTLLSTTVFGCYLMVSEVGFNQSTYQRFASLKTLQTAQRLVLFFLIGLYLLWIMFYFSGLVAFATYSKCDPLTSGRIYKPDQIIPFLVSDKLSHLSGMSGVFVAAVYGGVLSTLSSCGNSCACVIWEDFLKDRPYCRRLSDAKATNIIKLLSVGSGLAAIIMSLMVEKLGSIHHVASSILSAITGPLSGLFISGICTPWVSTKGAIVGFLTSLVFSVWVVIGKFLRGGGSPARLPLSIEGCSGNLTHFFNTTVNNSLTNILLTDGHRVNTSVTDALLVNTTAAHEMSSKTIYEISYCYTGAFCVVVTLVISSLVSLFTGVVPPHETDGVNPAFARVYQRMWNFFSDRSTSKQETVTEEEAVNMLVLPNPMNLNTPS
nr:sodium-coupled monocarboxylate transporter 1-like isoform X1 [Cherax quadricarinatus]